MQVVEIATDTGSTVGGSKFTLAIAVGVDILPCPLGRPAANSPVGDSHVRRPSHEFSVKFSALMTTTRENKRVLGIRHTVAPALLDVGMIRDQVEEKTL
jgi:hypothetical protein